MLNDYGVRSCTWSYKETMSKCIFSHVQEFEKQHFKPSNNKNNVYYRNRNDGFSMSNGVCDIFHFGENEQDFDTPRKKSIFSSCKLIQSFPKAHAFSPQWSMIVDRMVERLFWKIERGIFFLSRFILRMPTRIRRLPFWDWLAFSWFVGVVFSIMPWA